MDVVELFGLKGIQHTPISIKNARVSQASFLFVLFCTSCLCSESFLDWLPVLLNYAPYHKPQSVPIPLKDLAQSLWSTWPLQTLPQACNTLLAKHVQYKILGLSAWTFQHTTALDSKQVNILAMDNEPFRDIYLFGV